MATWAPRTARKNLQAYVSGLRKAMGGGGRCSLVFKAAGYQISLGRSALDAAKFDALARQGRSCLRSGDPSSATGLLRAALDLWQGPALAEFAGNPVLQHEADRLTARRIEAYENLDTVRIDVDPRSISDSTCAALLDRMYSAGATVRIFQLPNRFRVPCFGVEVWTEDFPVVALCWGAHLAAEVAASRALTEAAQSRLATIVGTREDLPPVYDHVRRGTTNPLTPPEQPASWTEVTAGQAPRFTDITDELAAVVTLATEVTGAEPMVVDLSTDDDIAVVHVVLPGAGIDVDRIHPNNG